MGKRKKFSKKDLAKIRKELVERKAEILEDVLRLQKNSLKTSLKDASGDLSGYSFHMADMATDLYEREFSLQIAENERERLYSLDEAIKRVDLETYGMCSECDVPITKQRLKVIPEAELCIKCQEKSEKK